MIEIYQEQIFDLLNPSFTENGGRFTVRNDNADSGPEIQGLHIAHPQTSREALLLYQAGMRLRRLGASEKNARSSRSHTVFSIYLCQSHTMAAASKISLVDLAGSERQSTTAVLDRTRVSEACFINQSLTSLGKVVQACILRSSCRQAEKDRVHVPYRDSILTRVLSDSIGGNAKTLMIVHVTPHAADLQESYRTLQFAANASCVQERVTKQGGDGELRYREIAKLIKQNARLRAELEENSWTAPSSPKLLDAGMSPRARAR